MPRPPWALLCLVLWAAVVPAAGKTTSTDEVFLAAKAKEKDVVVLPSGLMYKVLREGSGDRHPRPEASCTCNYKGTLVDGTEFDSSYGRGGPTSVKPNQLISGWAEAIQLMVEGDAWELYIPSELGYGEVGSPPKIKGGDVLIFEMELVAINGNTMPSSRCDPNRENKGCDDVEIKYIEKIAAAINGDTAPLKAVLKNIKRAGDGPKGKKVLLKWMKGDLGIRPKHGKLSTKWYSRIKRILRAMANPTVTIEGKPMPRKTTVV